MEKKPRNKQIPRKKKKKIVRITRTLRGVHFDLRVNRIQVTLGPKFYRTGRLKWQGKKGDSLDGRCSRSHVGENMVLLLLLGNRIEARENPSSEIRKYAARQRLTCKSKGGGKGEPVDSKLGCHDARISAEKRQDFRIVALHTERPILFSRFEMWVAARLYVGIVVSLFFCRFFFVSLSFSLFSRVSRSLLCSMVAGWYFAFSERLKPHCHFHPQKFAPLRWCSRLKINGESRERERERERETGGFASCW